MEPEHDVPDHPGLGSPVAGRQPVGGEGGVRGQAEGAGGRGAASADQDTRGRGSDMRPAAAEDGGRRADY